MTFETERERVLRLANEANLTIESDNQIYARSECKFDGGCYINIDDEITKLIELSRAEALEEAAKLCDDIHHDWKWDDEPDSTSGPHDCAKAIRARKDK